MYCKKCGNLIPDDSKFCPECGADLTEEVSEADILFNDSIACEEQHENAAANVFSIVGFVFGLSSIVFCWMPFFLGIISFSVPGLIFSSIGKNSVNEKFLKKARSGKTMSWIGFALNIVFSILIIASMAWFE